MPLESRGKFVDVLHIKPRFCSTIDKAIKKQPLAFKKLSNLETWLQI